jgi:predicted dehydrogenase
VVRQRLVPALVKQLPRLRGTASLSRRFEPVEIHPAAIHVFDVGEGAGPSCSIEVLLEFPNGSARPRRIPVKRELSSQDVVVEIAAAQVPVIIASPPDSHFFYVAMMAMHGVRFAVEKPITVFEPEVRSLVAEGDRLFADGFAMSYYALEKALPLTYLYTMHPLHRNHLDLYVSRGGYRAVDTLPWNEVIGGLGRPDSIRVLLLEGVGRSPSAGGSNRQWTEDPNLGGLYYETAIHAITVLHKVLGDLSRFDPTVLAMVSQSAVRHDSCSFVHMHAPAVMADSTAGAAVDLVVGKYMPESLCARGVVIDYAGAVVCCDFDSMALRIRPKGATFTGSDIASAAVAVREHYAQVRYGVQASLIRTFFEYGWQGARFDDYATQLAVLSWLSRSRARLLEAQRQMGRYGPDGEGLPAELAAWVAAYRQQRPDRSEFQEG